MSSRGLSELVLVVADVPKAARFYAEVVGLELEHETGEEWAWFWTGRRGDPQRIALHRGPLLFEEHSPYPPGELLGSIGWRIVDQGNFQIGYWVKTEARGRGAATRALRLLSRWALDELGLPRAQLLAEPANRASQRVAEKVGFRRECVLRSYLDVRGERRDGVMFALLRGEL